MKKKKIELAPFLKKLEKMPDTWEKRLFFMGILTKALKKDNLTSIVVGGHAVEFYTLGNYTTGDIDIVIADTEPLNRILKGWGFKKEGRHWYSEKYDLALESPAWQLDGNKEKIWQIETEGLEVYLIGIEDIIIDRLNAYVHWRSLSDGEWAETMLRLHQKKIDWKYLTKRCREEKTIEVLRRLKRKLRRG